MDVEPATSATSTETIRRSPAVTDTGELYAARWAIVGDAASALARVRGNEDQPLAPNAHLLLSRGRARTRGYGYPPPSAYGDGAGRGN
jgi:hypothetical protein